MNKKMLIIISESGKNIQKIEDGVYKVKGIFTIKNGKIEGIEDSTWANKFKEIKK